VNDATVAAVVLRADSPGGDPLPSDLVAGAIRRLNEAGKPVIVSQGDVAASGGYWISMAGAEILTTPLTVTGSIGVIGAWIYADELSEKTGMAYDGVKRGEHADLLRPLRDPLLGIALPHRALDEQELDLAREYILEAYENFVTQVAEARELSVEHVREVAQGRVWMGGDAIEIELCDRFGGLDAAIAAARQRAGLAPGREVALVEYPPRPLIDLAGLLGRGRGPLGFPFGLLAPVEDGYARLAAAAPWRSVPEPPAAMQGDGGDFDYARWYLESLDGRLGKPRCVLAPDVLPEGWGLPD
jgi:protease-4